MTRAQMLYIVVVLTAVALALIPLTMIVVTKRAHSEPVLLIIPYKVYGDGMREAYWRRTVRGITGLPMVV